MRAGMRPVLMHSRLTDPGQKFVFGDGIWVSVPGGAAAVQATADVVYLAVSVRNCGTGMAILHGSAGTGRPDMRRHAPAPVAEFTPQTRDLYVAASDVGFWQGALRDPEQPGYADVIAAVTGCEPIWVELLYGDFEGGQRVISRFNLIYRDGRHLGHRPRPGRPRRRAGGWPRWSGTGTWTARTPASRRPPQLGESGHAAGDG